MLETFDSTTGWSAGTDTANIAAETTTVFQGGAALKFDKNGTSGTTGTITKKLHVPMDIHLFYESPRLVKCRFYHANFTNVSTITLRLVYRYDSAGAADRYEDYQISSLTGAQWNTLSVDIASPSATSGSMTADLRSRLQGLQVIVTMGAAANTITGLICDAAEITSPASLPQIGVIVFDGYRLLVPPFKRWSPSIDTITIGNMAEQASERLLVTAKAAVAFGWDQIRHAYASDVPRYGLEESLGLFAQYALANDGWSVARRADRIINTTLNGAVSAGDTSITVDSITDIQNLHSDVTYLRIGPSDARQYDFVGVVSRSSSTLYLDQPLRHAHEDAVAVRSHEFYPSMSVRGGSWPIVIGPSNNDGVRFDLTALETA